MLIWLIEHAWAIAFGYGLGKVIVLPGIDRWIVDKYRDAWEWLKDRVR